LNKGGVTSGTEVHSEGELMRTMPPNLTDIEDQMTDVEPLINNKDLELEDQRKFENETLKEILSDHGKEPDSIEYPKEEPGSESDD
jgi:hypothetical protein